MGDRSGATRYSWGCRPPRRVASDDDRRREVRSLLVECQMVVVASERGEIALDEAAAAVVAVARHVERLLLDGPL